MEESVSAVVSKSEKKSERRAQQTPTMKKLDAESAKLLASIREKANKKAFGRKVRETEILAVALKLVGPKQIQELQDATLSEQDRLRLAHESYQQTNS